MSWVHTALPKLPPVYCIYSHLVFQISTWMSCQHLRFCSSFSQLQTQFSVCIRKRNRFTRVAQQEIYLLIHVFSFSFRDKVKLKRALQWRHCFQQRRWQLNLCFAKLCCFRLWKQARMTMLSSDVWAEEVSNANNQPSSTWLISKQSWRRLRCSLASWRDWRLLSLRALLNFSPLARYIRTQDKLWVHSLECLELSIMLGDAQMFYTTGKGCLWVWGNLTATNHVVLRLILSLHESCH